MAKDRDRKVIGPAEHDSKHADEQWLDIDWRNVEKRVRNLRQRIFRATKNGQWNQVRSLMKLMLRSYSNLLLSVRKVTQENKGRGTPGIDRRLALTPKARMKLVQEMLELKSWRVQPAIRVYIPKANGNTTPTLLPNSASADFGSGKPADTKRHINAIFTHVDLFYKRPDHIALCLPIQVGQLGFNTTAKFIKLHNK